jgi:hypothetical protein
MRCDQLDLDIDIDMELGTIGDGWDACGVEGVKTSFLDYTSDVIHDTRKFDMRVRALCFEGVV